MVTATATVPTVRVTGVVTGIAAPTTKVSMVTIITAGNATAQLRPFTAISIDGQQGRYQ